MKGQDDFFALIQQAEGVLGDPVLVKATVKENLIEFTLPVDAGTVGSTGKFIGKISVEGLRGKFENDLQSVFLRRKKSYWQ